jgi:chromosome segregation ATPase
MWLYHKGEATPPQLINHLMRSGMNLKGEAGHHVESRAFAFVASMVKSTNKRKFAYFVDYVGKNEAKLTAQIRQAAEKNRELSQETAKLQGRLRSAHSELDQAHLKNDELQTQLDKLRGQFHELEEQRKHDSVHHGATIESADSQFNTTLKELAEHLRLARTALERGPEKRHILEYQLDEMVEIVSKGTK